MATRIKTSTLALIAVAVALIGASSAGARLSGVSWMKGYAAPGTPAKYDRVGAYPHNAFFKHLVKFLKRVSRER